MCERLDVWCGDALERELCEACWVSGTCVCVCTYGDGAWWNEEYIWRRMCDVDGVIVDSCYLSRESDADAINVVGTGNEEKW